ncbi:hypothetical protein GGX14DRAFT_592135 [Mycena pura]|uniref:Uncharacterized protein n=1 Tax=Mycena pura TaxID=153505 RepID=A0AAD6YIG3_9AGAR|nr:hypothetical protein GGX14DRAFT_592135 [Mycena pura]
MPSLRRTLSSPSVRTAPYPAAMLSGSPPSTASRSSAHRRSTDSETSFRRVLADIEWWRVADGQRDLVPEQEQEEPDRDPDQEVEDDLLPDQVAAVPAPHGARGDRGVEHPLMLAHLSLLELGSPEMPIAEMAALSIAPVTPRRHALESSTSSLESTPGASHVQAEHPFLDWDALNVGLHHTEVPAPVLRRARSDTSPILLSQRSFAAAFTSYERQYADFGISPLSSSPIFSN